MVHCVVHLLILIKSTSLTDSVLNRIRTQSSQGWRDFNWSSSHVPEQSKARTLEFFPDSRGQK